MKRYRNGETMNSQESELNEEQDTTYVSDAYDLVSDAYNLEGALNLPWGALRETGVLWLINRAVFHPRGFALALNFGEEGDPIGWQILGDGTEPWVFEEETDDDRFLKVEAFLNGLRPDER